MSDFSLNINIPAEHTGNIFGQFDKNIKAIEKGMNISFIPREDSIKVVGDKEHVKHGISVVDELLSLSKKGNIITTRRLTDSWAAAPTWPSKIFPSRTMSMEA